MLIKDIVNVKERKRWSEELDHKLDGVLDITIFLKDINKNIQKKKKK